MLTSCPHRGEDPSLAVLGKLVRGLVLGPKDTILLGYYSVEDCLGTQLCLGPPRITQ